MASKTMSRLDWARRRHDGQVGQVVRRKGNRYSVRFLGSRRAESIGGKGLKTARAPMALLLEGSLDSHLTSSRSESRILDDWLRSHFWESRVAYKNIHRLEDLDIIGRQIAASDYLFVHFNCHGAAGGKRGPYIKLFPGKKTFLLEDASIETFKRHFAGRDILFSACELGRYEASMRQFKERAALGEVAAYSRSVCDYEATIVDLCIYQSILGNACTFRTAVTRALEAVRNLGIVGPGHLELLRVF
jgi:hypothetical protein